MIETFESRTKEEFHSDYKRHKIYKYSEYDTKTKRYIHQGYTITDQLSTQIGSICRTIKNCKTVINSTINCPY